VEMLGSFTAHQPKATLAIERQLIWTIEMSFAVDPRPANGALPLPLQLKLSEL